MDATDIKIAVTRQIVGQLESGKRIASPTPANSSATAGNTAPVQAAAQMQLRTRSELDVNQSVERVISRVLDQSGTVINQIPSETELRLLERSRQVIGAFLNRTA